MEQSEGFDSARDIESVAKKSEHPIYFSGGFGYGEGKNNSVLRHLEAQGYTTLPTLPDVARGERNNKFTVSTEKGNVVLSRMQTLLGASKMHPDQVISQYQKERAEALIKLLDEQDRGDGVWGIFQSADAINGVLAMYERPDLVDSAILAYPAGIISQPNVLSAASEAVRTAWTARKAVRQEPTSAENKIHDTKPRKEVGASNFTIAASVALTDQTKMLAEIRERPDAPGIWLVLGMQDAMIRPYRVIESLRSPNDVDGILITNQPHGINDRGDEFAEWLKLFPLMDNMKKARLEGSHEIRPLAHPDRLQFFGTVSETDKSKFRDLASSVDSRAK